MDTTEKITLGYIALSIKNFLPRVNNLTERDRPVLAALVALLEAFEEWECDS